MVAITRGLFGHAAPGPWYGAYREDWHLRHPEACAVGELEIGHFRWGVWCSSTLNWDSAWFRQERLDADERRRNGDADTER